MTFFNLFYFSLTVHYRDDDFVPKKSLFGVTEINESTTADNIKIAIVEYLKFVGLDLKKMVCSVRDDAPNVKKASELFKKPKYFSIVF